MCYTCTVIFSLHLHFQGVVIPGQYTYCQSYFGIHEYSDKGGRGLVVIPGQYTYCQSYSGIHRYSDNVGRGLVVIPGQFSYCQSYAGIHGYSAKGGRGLVVIPGQYTYCHSYNVLWQIFMDTLTRGVGGRTYNAQIL